MAGIKDYSTTQADNTSLNGISTAEGMLPSNLNNAIRALMKNTRDFYNDAQWVEYGDGSGSYTAAYVSGTAFTINGVDVTSEYHAGRRIKVYLATTAAFRYGIISSSSFSTNTTVNVTWDSGSLANETLSVYLAILTKTNDSIPTGISATKIADGTISDTEFQYLNGVSSAIQNQLDAKQATITGSASTIDTESLTANRAVISNGSQKIAVSDVTSTELGYLDGVSSNVQTQINTKAATSYVDDAVAGLRTRIICRAATTANIDLSADLQNGDTLDGVTLATGNKVLVKNQSTDSQNGIYIVVSSGTAGRDPQFDTVAELAGQMVVVQEGSAGADKLFLCTSDSSGSIGSVSITFSQITPQNTGTVTSITAGTGLSGGAITSSGTIAIDSTVATLTGSQTLTNKTLTAPKVNEDVAVTSTATELNLLDGATVIIPGKVGGTNFTDSLLVGHSTTGTLDSASANTGVGSGSLKRVTSGDNNTMIGYNAGQSILGGRHNTSVGRESGNSINSGLYNICLGYQAGQNITSGDGNVMIGAALNADSATGDHQLKIVGHNDSATVTWITGNSSGVLTFNAANVTQQALTSSSNAVAWDASAKPNAVHVTTENTTFSAPTNNVEGAFIALEINYNGSHTIAFNTVFEFAASTAPTFTSADGKTDILVFRYNGAVWQEVGRTLNLSES